MIQTESATDSEGVVDAFAGCPYNADMLEGSRHWLCTSTGVKLAELVFEKVYAGPNPDGHGTYRPTDASCPEAMVLRELAAAADDCAIYPVELFNRRLEAQGVVMIEQTTGERRKLGDDFCGLVISEGQTVFGCRLMSRAAALLG